MGWWWWGGWVVAFSDVTIIDIDIEITIFFWKSNGIYIAIFLEQVWLDSDSVSPYRDRRSAQEVTECVLHSRRSDNAECRGVYTFNF